MEDKTVSVLEKGLQAIAFVGITIVLGCGAYHVMLYILINLGV